MKNGKCKIKKGDLVEVISGKEKGKRGNVLRVDKAHERIFVTQLNLVKKHVRRRDGQAGQLIEKEAGIHVSNVMIVDPQSDKPTRVAYKILENGDKVRVAKRSGEQLDKE
ncbi:MAG: 50S ribosomal protein L24 [Candidatus Cloacimonetes bacterium]|nr:50S ribosomal protein L24 [Candidatus Cloacimonadota bacterium]